MRSEPNLKVKAKKYKLAADELVSIGSIGIIILIFQIMLITENADVVVKHFPFSSGMDLLGKYITYVNNVKTCHITQSLYNEIFLDWKHDYMNLPRNMERKLIYTR